MGYVRLDTLDDPRLDVYARLTEAQLRNKLEPERGVFIAESVKVIDRALEGGMVPVSMLMTPGWVEQTADAVRRAQEAWERAGEGAGDVGEPGAGADEGAVAGSASGSLGSAPEGGLPVFVLPDDQARRLTGFSVTRGIMMACRRPPLESVEGLLARVDAQRAAAAAARGLPDDGRRLIAVLDGVVDHTNVGAIFRSAAALGVDAVLATPTCCDPLYRRAVRVSMGTVFQVPWTRIGEGPRDWPAAGLSRLRSLGYTTAAMALSDDSIPLGSPRLAAADKLALVFGTEGDGLSRRAIEGCDVTVRIPMQHGVDSLNVAAASAVAFWELRR